MTQHTVRDGLFKVVFEGTFLGHSDTHREGTLRWVEMDLYWAEPGQDHSSPLLRLPDGGYVTHIIGQSVVAHRVGAPSCGGLSVSISEMVPDALPCPVCTPGPFPVMRHIDPSEYQTGAEREELLDIEAERITALRQDYAGVLNVESPRHTLRRALTARDAVRRIVGPKLSWPAEVLLHEAAKNDPLIKMAMEDPSTAA